MTSVAFLPVAWVRLEHYCGLTGEPPATVQNRIRAGKWREGFHWKVRERRRWVHLERAQAWVEQDDAEVQQAWR